MENLDTRQFLQKSGKTWNSPGVFYKFYPSEGKVRENKLFSRHIAYLHGFFAAVALVFQ